MYNVDNVFYQQLNDLMLIRIQHFQKKLGTVSAAYSYTFLQNSVQSSFYYYSII
jgi:hypothetical protein